MKIDILTTFPEMFPGVLGASILGRAQQAGLLDVRVTDIRPFSACKHHNTDDYPFGGGAGMVMLAQPICDAMRAVAPEPYEGVRVFMSPRGVPLTQPLARQLAQKPAMAILCGHYEGVDERAIEKCIDLEISVGDYVLTGGELAAMVLIDCVSRMIPGVLGSALSPEEESFSGAGLLEYPQYTRPRVFEDRPVPEALLSGDHARIARYRREQSLRVTAARRPDLLTGVCLTPDERALVQRVMRGDEKDGDQPT